MSNNLLLLLLLLFSYYLKYMFQYVHVSCVVHVAIDQVTNAAAAAANQHTSYQHYHHFSTLL